MPTCRPPRYRGVIEENARLLRAARGDDPGATRVGADQVPLDDIARRGGPLDQHPGGRVARDQVARDQVGNDPSTKTPAALASGSRPDRFVPISFPCTALSPALTPKIWTPGPTLPEIRLADPGVVPPIVLNCDPLMSTPSWFGTATVPAALVPMELPSTRFRRSWSR